MSVHFLSLVIACQAARMDHFFDAQVEGLILPDIADRAKVDFWKPEAWQGLEQLQLTDFEDSKTLNMMQQHEQFAPFVQQMISIFWAFANASKVELPIEHKMSLVLKWHLAKLDFFENFGKKAGQDEDCNLHMFLLSQAVNRYPDLLSAFTNFRTQINIIRDDMQNAQVQWDKVEVPKRLGIPGIKSIDVTYYYGVGLIADNVIENFMPELTTGILTAFRNRIVQTVQEHGIPNDLILAASLQENWISELKKLREVDQIRQAFVPVWQARGNKTKQQALLHFTWFLINPRIKTNANAVSVLKDVIVNQDDRVALLQFAHQGNKAKENKAMILDMFIHQALNLVAVDNGKFLAGLIHSIWITKGDRLSKTSNLYKRSLSHFGRLSWRQFIQEELLRKSNNDEHVKEILKRLLEGVFEVHRNSSKQHFEGRNVANGLLQYLSNNVKVLFD